MSETTTRAAWLELLEGWGRDCAGCTPEELDGLGVTGPEATAWYAFCAADHTEQLAGALASPWALHTPEQVGAVAAALTAVQWHAERAKRRLLDLLTAMAERGEAGPVPPGLPELLAAAPSEEAADRLLAELSTVPLLRPVPGTLAGALRGTAELLGDLLVPEEDAVEVFGDPDEPDHQGWARLRHEGSEWRLYFHSHDEDEWFLDDFPAEPGTRLPLGGFSAGTAHPAQLAAAARAALAQWAAEHR
ncbi:hypothetical protein Kpho02_70570 [Kitasatospora phosalacinea]|uniref:Uncharacterized protein n=1 Tax=Kitasatospora phosalacinea TaxID=2065 RepID=A0A9W6QCS3_9ACTN|nr:hypothetical protein [Kitasatospora phosalacinea]GLW74760.1 hypothetical protein Kpho02_70570 [Kitasatospora phosalacinea]